jgi:hypothetical protein
VKPCANEHCAARVEPARKPGGYCSACFRQLPAETRRTHIKQLKRGLRRAGFRGDRVWWFPLFIERE